MRELDEALHSARKEYELDGSLICADRGSSSERLIKLITGKADESDFDIEDYGSKPAPGIVYFDNINRDDVRGTLDEIQRLPDRPVIMFAVSMTPETIETLKTFSRDTEFIRISGHLYCSNNEFRLLRASRRFGIFRSKAEAIYDRESRRQIRQFKAASFEVKQCRNVERLQMLARIPSKKH